MPLRLVWSGFWSVAEGALQRMKWQREVSRRPQLTNLRGTLLPGFQKCVVRRGPATTTHGEA